MNTFSWFAAAAFALAQGTAPPPRAPAADYSQEAFVIEQARTSCRFETDGTGRREISMRIRTQSEAGVQRWGQVVVGYNAASERIEIPYVRVRKADGSIVTTPADAVQDLSSPVERIAPVYTDFRQKHVTVQSLRPGDTLEFDVVTTIHTALASGHFWMDYDFQDDDIVLDERLEVDVPAGRTLILKTAPGSDPAVSDANGRRVYRWTSSHLQREDEKALAKKNAARSEPDPPAVRLTTFQDWAQVGRWYASLEAPSKRPTPEIQEKARDLTKDRRTDLEKAEALYDFVATNFRYVSLSLGAGRYQPRAAPEVLRGQYGDCKDKHTLLASLLAAAGVRASAVLINSRRAIDPEFPSPAQFDHVITRAIVGGDAVWLDTTAEVAPFRLLAFPIRDKQGLLVDADGTPRLERTPADPPVPSSLAQEVDGKIGDAGTLNAKVRLIARGDPELLLRTLFRGTPAARWKSVLEDMSARLREGVDGQVTDYHVSDPAATREPFVIDFTVEASAYVDWGARKLQVALPYSGLDAPTLGDSDAASPVKLGPPQTTTYKLRIELPAAAKARAPLPVTVTRDYGEYRGAYSLAGNVFSAERVLVLRRSELTADRREDFAAFSRVVAADSRQGLALEATDAMLAAPASELKASDLNRSARDALQAGDYAKAIALLKRVVEMEPKDKTAWMSLGAAYIGQRDFDAAAAAFRKQIELNPYDQSAYTSLGWTCWQLHKYADAEAAFLKQIEINPLDQYAHGNLGMMYLEQHQDEKAAPELEKSASLNPDNSSLQVQLGKVFLRLKRTDDARAAFARAVQLTPEPGTWNNVAYELTLGGVDLDRAQQYAESAVSAIAAASRNLDVDNADARALAIVGSLAAYWDTLGWVAFAKGDLAAAEKYVGAAWQLSQHAEVGDHLGQIYEKLGRGDAAVRTYAQALSAIRPDPQVREHLARAAGAGANLESLIAAHRDELAQIRTLTLDTRGPAGKHADFLVLFSQPSAVAAVKFVGGDEELRPRGADLQKLTPPKMFPDANAAKLLRRGTLACPADGGRCTFTMLLPEDARPVK